MRAMDDIRWKYTIMQDGWKQDKDGRPTPAEVMDVVTGDPHRPVVTDL